MIYTVKDIVCLIETTINIIMAEYVRRVSQLLLVLLCSSSSIFIACSFSSSSSSLYLNDCSFPYFEIRKLMTTPTRQIDTKSKLSAL